MLDDLGFALHLADRADEISARYFSSGPVAFVVKSDGSPVTAADREVEQTLQQIVEATSRSDGFLGEEVGPSGSTSRRWIVDGIDGTHAFAAGRPEWGTLIALEEEGDVRVGVASSPGLRRRWWAARGRGAWTAPLDGAQRPERLQVSTGTRRGPVRGVVLPSASHLRGWRREVAAWAERTYMTPDASGHGPLLVAAGNCDVSVHLGGGPWDHAAFVVIVEEAGGQFVDLWGSRHMDTLTAVFGTPQAVETFIRGVSDLTPAVPDL